MDFARHQDLSCVFNQVSTRSAVQEEGLEVIDDVVFELRFGATVTNGQTWPHQLFLEYTGNDQFVKCTMSCLMWRVLAMILLADDNVMMRAWQVSGVLPEGLKQPDEVTNQITPFFQIPVSGLDSGVWHCWGLNDNSNMQKE